MLTFIYKLYAYIFGRRIFSKFNKFLYHISLRGLGILNYYGEYFIGEKYWLREYLKNIKRPVVIDVGAHVGDYTRDVLECNQGALIFAFEPHPMAYKKLITNVTSNNIHAFNLAVGNVNGITELYDYDTEDSSVHASLYKDVIEGLHKGKSKSYSVNIIKLDDFLQEKDIDRIDLLKIDTEGNEYNVLLGVESYLRSNKIRAIHFEFNEMNIVSKVSFKDFWDLLDKYKFYRILPGGELLEIKNYYPVSCEIYAFQNIVAILDESRIPNPI